MNVRAVTKISAILMVVFIGIETFLSFLRLVDAGNNMADSATSSSSARLRGSCSPQSWRCGSSVSTSCSTDRSGSKMAAFVAMVVAAGLKVFFAWLIYLFSGNSGYYGYGYSDGAATAIAWIGFFALLGLLAQVIVLLVGWLQQRV